MAPQRHPTSSTSEQTARGDIAFRKFCSAIVEPGKQGRFKSLLNRDNRKVVCQLKSSTMGLDLLQVAVLWDDAATVEQLISLGADVKVTLRQEDTLAWPLKEMPYPCVLSERGKYHWVAKVKHLGMLQTRSEALSGSTFNLIHLAVLTYSPRVVRLLISRGHSDVNERAGRAGLTPLLVAALGDKGFVPDLSTWEPMRGMVDLLLELGGDLKAVNVVGNDFVAIAASAYRYGMWEDIIKDPGLLAKCPRKHAGRIAVQLLYCFISAPKQVPERRVKWWTEQMQELADVWVPDARARKDPTWKEWRRLVKELSEPVLQRILPPQNPHEVAFMDMCDLRVDDATEHDQIETNVMSNILQGVAVMPCNLEMPREVAMEIIDCLRGFGVSPDCLLLPWRPGHAYSRLCSKESLVGLIDGTLAGSGGSLAQFAQVFVQQMWHFVLSCSRMASRHPVFTGESDNIGTLLLMLRQRGIDWTNLELWPKEMVDGQLGQLSPLLTLLDGAPEVIIPVCTELRKLWKLASQDFVNAVDCKGRSPLISAAKKAKPEVVDLMLTCEANPRKQGSTWFAFYYEAQRRGYLMLASSMRSVIKTHAAEVSEDFKEYMERERSQQGARTAEGAPPSPPDMAARDADPQQQSQEASDESQDGSNVPAKGHSLLQEAIAAVAGAQMGFHALLLPLQLPAVAPNKVLFMQCMFALNAVQGSTLRGPSQPEMRALLEMLLAPEEDSPVTAKVLATRIPDTGVTLLGHAVAWGYADALPPLLDAVRRHHLDPVDLLDCSLHKSKFHKPLFAAVVYGYDGILGEVLQGINLQDELSGKLPAAMLEHIVVDRAVTAASRAKQMQTLVSKPHAGTETIDLLMCAASAGNASVVDALLQAGADPRQQRPFSTNRYYKSAMHAAVQYTDMAMLMSESCDNSHSTSLPGSNQVRCVERLLKAGGAMTVEQLNIVLTALPTLGDPKVARSAWRLLEAHMAVCIKCGLLGCWGRCAGCQAAPYCSAECHRRDWPKHKPKCHQKAFNG